MREARDARQGRDVRETREGRQGREARDAREQVAEPRERVVAEVPGEAAVMRVPPRSRWQVLLLEYELLDSYWTYLQQRVWMSGLVLVGLSMVGITFMAVGLTAGDELTLRVVGLVGAVAVLLTLGWWLLLRRTFTLQHVSEYRKREIERELGMRQELYLSYLRQGRLVGLRRADTLAERMAEGDAELTDDLRKLAHSSEARPWFPQLMGERLVWSLVPWLLIAAWVALYMLKRG
ncbi:MAG: hypothetical protein HYY00_05000 [Chloroflexi bacterium]|nr:hypothetical protein [Chloroflexota bacterium]